MASWTADEFRSCIEDVIYCSGGWDAATRERWRREASMVRR